jgi:hypothetical protein
MARACVLLQGLELLVTVLLARNRQPPVAAGVPHAELAAELISLPSGLLAMVCEAIVKLKVRLGAACACVLAAWAIGEGRRGPGACGGACQSRVGAGLASRAGRTVCGVLEVPRVVPDWILLRFPMWPEPAPIPSVRAL